MTPIDKNHDCTFQSQASSIIKSEAVYKILRIALKTLAALSIAFIGATPCFIIGTPLMTVLGASFVFVIGVGAFFVGYKNEVYNEERLLALRRRAIFLLISDA